MIGGINPNGNPAFQSSNNSPVRERSDVARAPATAPETSRDVIGRRLSDPSSRAAENRPAAPTESLERRIEARQAAEDARLERFRADEIPFNTSRALSTFADVAGRGDGSDSGLAGIDILV